jgi:hypothetical protein
MRTKGERALAWRRVDTPGLERFEMRGGGAGWTLHGTILLVDKDVPFEARYELACDPGWRTRAVAVDIRGPEGDRSLRLTARDGIWRRDGGAEIEAIRGCLDVDLSWSPSTNTLPIRRLDLAIGEEKGTAAAWVRFPGLAVEPLPQEYRRLADTRYRYSSAGGSFVAELDVDDDGLVTRYGNIWTRAVV